MKNANRRDDWKEYVIATATLMGAEFDQRPRSVVQNRLTITILTHYFCEPYPDFMYSQKWEAAYWYLVDAFNLSVQNDHTIIAAKPKSKLLYRNTNASVRRHQSASRCYHDEQLAEQEPR